MSAGSALQKSLNFTSTEFLGWVDLSGTQQCNFFSPPILLSTISKKAFDLNLQGGACECYHYEHNFNWNIISQGSCTISETDNFEMR